jgi:radical SAM protein with 4Fe4S-binding SPASM domain
VHCYSQSRDQNYPNELSNEEGKRLLADLAEFGAPVILFSGGEPLMRPDIFELIQFATSRKMRAVVSTNGTLITPEIATRLKDAGLSYVGISLDGMEATNDRFRGVKGAFRMAMDGVQNCLKTGVKVGLRFTMTRENYRDVGEVLDLIEREGIPRVCFYHLVYAGRGTKLIHEARMSHEETRNTVDLIMDRTKDFHDRGKKVEVLTVDNHTDGPYLYLRLLKEDPVRAAEVLKLLKMNGGNSSGTGIGCVSWDGSVHPDQFWRHYSFGNVTQKPFSKIWTDTSEPLMGKLRERKKYLTGRCAACKWLDICNGNFRVRAEAMTGDVWAPEPDCYLTDKEIGL